MLNSHVLLVPEKAELTIERLLVPTDFSSDSALSFHVASNVAKLSNASIEALHVYGIPSFFFPYIDKEKAHEETKKHLSNRFEQFKKRHNLMEALTFKFVNKNDLSIVETIEKEAIKNNSSMIIVSARGANNLTSLFIGSTTNELLIRDRKMPLLVVKK
jgi:nucleotide-binding universal stress UspA family protein